MGLYDEQFVAHLERMVASAAPRWGLSPRTRVSLITVSENATFRADDPDRDQPVIIRVYRPGYHTLDEIEGELAWLEALRRDRIVTTPEVLRTRAGERVIAVADGGETRALAAFSFLPGREPSADEALVDGFRTLGEISARLHAHARAWRPPAGFRRKRWDFATTLGESPHWGPWRAALGLEREGEAVLARAVARLAERLAAYGTGEERFGLIHADLRLANLLVDEERIGVIDFDDCGYGWFAYDFAAAVSFLEHDPIVPALMEAWLEGYARVAPLEAADRAMLEDFVMLRRILLTAWIASHAETPTAREAGLERYTAGTVMLAERYLQRR